jgi:hypothetical protein
MLGMEKIQFSDVNGDFCITIPDYTPPDPKKPKTAKKIPDQVLNILTHRIIASPSGKYLLRVAEKKPEEQANQLEVGQFIKGILLWNPVEK